MPPSEEKNLNFESCANTHSLHYTELRDAML